MNKMKSYTVANTFYDIQFDKNGFYVYYEDEKDNKIFYCYNSISNISKLKRHIVNQKIDGILSTLKFITFTISFNDASYIHISSDIFSIRDEIKTKLSFIDLLKRRCTFSNWINQNIENPKLKDFLSNDNGLEPEYSKLYSLKEQLISKL